MIAGINQYGTGYQIRQDVESIELGVDGVELRSLLSLGVCRGYALLPFKFVRVGNGVG